MLVTVDDDDRGEGIAPLHRLVLPELESPGEEPSDLRDMAIGDSTNPAALLVFSDARPLVSAEQVDRALAALDPGSVVVATAPVADTTRDDEGNLVDRSSLVEVTTPLVIGAEVAARLVRHDERLPATVTGLLEAAMGAGADIVLISDDGSGQWAGRPDHLAVARARVGP